MLATMAVIGELRVHPIKALDPVSLEKVRVLPSGALEHDRRWALFDERGQFVNGKNRVAIHSIHVEYDLDLLEVSLDGGAYSLERQSRLIAKWFSERLNEPVTLREAPETGFPDDTSSPGPTFVSRGSLESVAEWFDLDLEETRLRFRTNVELCGVDPFWEDHLYGHCFTVGHLEFEAVNPCQRCVVPSRHPVSGVVLSGFQRRFADRRQSSLPAAAEARFFNHYYRLAVNTRLAKPSDHATLQRGDAVRSL